MSPCTIFAARPISTRASTTSRSPISTTRCGWAAPSGIVYHNRGNAFRRKGDYARAIADYDAAIRLSPKEAYSWENRGASKQALGDLDGALADINQAIRLAPDAALAADQPRGDLARQARFRSRGSRHDRGDPPRQGEAAGQGADAAEQRADPRPMSSAASPMR